MVVFLDKGRQDGVARGRPVRDPAPAPSGCDDGSQFSQRSDGHAAGGARARSHRHRPPAQRRLARHPGRVPTRGRSPSFRPDLRRVRRWRGAGRAPRRRVAFRVAWCPVPSPAPTYLYCGATVPFPRQSPDWRDHGETRRMSGRVLVTGGAGFIGSHIAEAYLAGGLGGRRPGRSLPRPRAERPDGRPLRARRHPLARGAEAARHRRRSTCSTITRRRSMFGFRWTSPPFDAESTWSGLVNLLEGAGEGGVRAGHLRQQRRGGLRRPRGHPHAGDRAQAAGVSLRREQARRASTTSGRWARCAGSRASPCATPTCSAPGRIPSRKPAWFRSSCPGCSPSEPLTVFGDGQQTRDYVFVKDVARANVLASTVPAPAGHRVRRARLQHRHRRASAACSSWPRPWAGHGQQKPRAGVRSAPAGRAVPQRARRSSKAKTVLGWAPEYAVRGRPAGAGRLVQEGGDVILQAGGAVPQSAVELVLVRQPRDQDRPHHHRASSPWSPGSSSSSSGGSSAGSTARPTASSPRWSAPPGCRTPTTRS